MMKKLKMISCSSSSAETTPRLWLTAVGSALLLTACMGEPTGRRSAVDAAKLCNGDKNAVFAGTCLQRGSGLGSPASREGGGGGGEDGLGGGEDAAAKERAEAEARAKALAEEEAKAKALAEAEALRKQKGGGEPPPIGEEERPPPVLKEPPPEERAPAVKDGAGKVRKLKFSRDTFVAVAQNSVIRNCFVPAETIVSFSGDLAPIDNFKALGIKQNIIVGVTDVQLPKEQRDECGLKGEDFLYLDSHAQLM